jgi:hypothetical protein
MKLFLSQFGDFVTRHLPKVGWAIAFAMCLYIGFDKYQGYQFRSTYERALLLSNQAFDILQQRGAEQSKQIDIALDGWAAANDMAKASNDNLGKVVDQLSVERARANDLAKSVKATIRRSRSLIPCTTASKTVEHFGSYDVETTDVIPLSAKDCRERQINFRKRRPRP